LGIGPEEAKAAVNLAVNVPSDVREELQAIAQKFGMRNGPFNHSVLAHQFFSIGKGPLHPVQAWQEALANTEDALKLLVQRLHNDWLALPPALRKAPSIQEFMGLQSRCAAYLHNLELLRVLVSEELFKAEKEKLDRKFLAKYMDMELDEEVKSSENPDPNRLPSMAAVIELHKLALKADMDSKYKELSERMAAASLGQMLLDLESDASVAEEYMQAPFFFFHTLDIDHTPVLIWVPKQISN